MDKKEKYEIPTMEKLDLHPFAIVAADSAPLLQSMGDEEGDSGSLF